MFKKSDFGIVFNTLFSLAFSTTLTLFVKFMNGGLTFETFCTGLLPAFAFNFVLGSYIPLMKMGNAFAHLFLKDEKHPLFYFLRMFAIVAVMTVAMSFLSMFCEMGFDPALPIAFVSSLPLTLLFAYVVACIVFPIVRPFWPGGDYLCLCGGLHRLPLPDEGGDVPLPERGPRERFGTLPRPQISESMHPDGVQRAALGCFFCGDS